MSPERDPSTLKDEIPQRSSIWPRLVHGTSSKRSQRSAQLGALGCRRQQVAQCYLIRNNGPRGHILMVRARIYSPAAITLSSRRAGALARVLLVGVRTRTLPPPSVSSFVSSEAERAGRVLGTGGRCDSISWMTNRARNVVRRRLKGRGPRPI